MPVERCSTKAFPGAAVISAAFEAEPHLLPVELLSVRSRTRSCSRRVVQRWQKNSARVEETNRYLAVLNSLNRGSVDTRTYGNRRLHGRAPHEAAASVARRPTYTVAQTQLIQSALRGATRFEWRRDQDPPETGGAALSKLLKLDVSDRYSTVSAAAPPRDSLRAADIDEPDHDRIVDMLDALPPDDAEYYSSEDNLLEKTGFSEIIFGELETQYGFVGGTYDEYCRYFDRELPANMWDFVQEDQVKALCGFAVVPKKVWPKQRKLLMQCAANYAWKSAKERGNHGLQGGTALAKLHVPSDNWSVAVCDESNCFTSVVVPYWMRAWVACPPLRARDVWKRLSQEQQKKVSKADWIFPRYCRLAMGGSHSVHIVMTINMYTIGKTLVTSRRIVEALCHADAESAESEDAINAATIVGGAFAGTTTEQVAAGSENEELADDAWLARHLAVARGVQSEPGAALLYSGSAAQRSDVTPDEWALRVRLLRQSETRVMTVLYLFAGPQRNGDVEEYLTQYCHDADIDLYFVAVDILRSALWNVADAKVMHTIMTVVEEGCIDIALAAPPCSTWSRLRFLPNGPRPIRFRGKWCWGRPDATPSEKEHLRLANCLIVNSMTICEGTSLRGGAHLLEHPKDPNEDPMPSIFATAEMLESEKRTGALRKCLDQCAYGSVAMKPTCLTGTVEGIEEAGKTCTCVRRHAKPTGRQSDGSFVSARLATYPAGLCKMIASMIFRTLVKFKQQGTGPTGWCRTGLPIPRVMHWSSKPTAASPVGVAFLNEETVRGNGVVVTRNQQAVYTHVDDTAAISADPDMEASRKQADVLMDTCADGLESIGFVVTDRQLAGDTQMLLGYEVIKSPAKLVVPVVKGRRLRAALRFLTRWPTVDTRQLHSLLGIWIWASLVRRDLLCIPQHIFKLLEDHPKTIVPWWPSVRREVLAMAAVIPAMEADVGAPLAAAMIATDAQGADGIDHGGFGIVAADISDRLAEQCFSLGVRPGRSVAKLDGAFTGMRHPEKAIERNVPFTRLPDELFSDTNIVWHEVLGGRWRFSDHITLGESRAVVRMVAGLAAMAGTHRHKVMSMQDNLPCTCSMTKGRSPKGTLNYLVRKKAANCLGANIALLLPWVQSKLQKADDLSRRACEPGASSIGRPPGF